MRSCRQHIQWQIRQSLAPSTTIRQISMQPPNLKPPNLKPPSLIATKVAFGFSEERRRERSGVRCQRDRPHMAWHYGTPLSPIRISSHINLTTLFSKPRVIGRESGPSFVPLLLPRWAPKTFPPRSLRKGTSDNCRQRERVQSSAGSNPKYFKSA